MIEHLYAVGLAVLIVSPLIWVFIMLQGATQEYAEKKGICYKMYRMVFK